MPLNMHNIDTKTILYFLAFQMDFRRLQQQLNMHQMDQNITQGTSMLTDSAENITPPQTNIFEHNVFSPENSPSTQHQPVSMLPTEHLGTAGNYWRI